MLRLTALALLLILAGCESRSAVRAIAPSEGLPCLASLDDPPVAAPGAIDAAWINDRALADAVNKGATLLADGGKAPPLEELLPGLKNETAAIALPAPEAAAVRDPASLYAGAADATVIVAGLYKCDRCNNWHTSNASGFFISADGLLVTNYHVVENEDRRAMVVATRDGRVFPVTKILAGNEAADVAIVKVEPVDAEGKPATFAALPLADGSRVGESAYAISHPDGRYWTFTEGMVSRRYTGHRGANWITITADYARGSSGGPVVNDRGQVIGIVASTSSVYYSTENGRQENLQMVWKQCVPVEAVRALIE